MMLQAYTVALLLAVHLAPTVSYINPDTSSGGDKICIYAQHEKADAVSNYDLTADSNLSNTCIHGLHEQTNVEFVHGDFLYVDYLVGDNLNVGETFSGMLNQEAATNNLKRLEGPGSYFSDLLHLGNKGVDGYKKIKDVTFGFQSDIKAVIVSNSGVSINGKVKLLEDSDDVFGYDTIAYDRKISRRSESGDSFMLLSSRQLLVHSMSVGAGGWVDEVRVITA
uniref:Uncharacterized protein n=1 Tax=Odontella aurita TaxID=265563 RepID=A0A7S4IX06_9STRA|mmetsp:Transcript_31561/g.94442  ORF Transcript_31561/g.94442 Transcript_31561/m.94442 type:complete len:223 (+) Transcript_31561:112-780(+)|eukprot:CAMPEP_0113551302 /NCGR_PEP_ID=MMETSP0015_2-20120614/14452_1 /TAXON_ID=2838 /ORGANISM="Odontella" /LENGTH=222 /DNA_ID=CAMNT_0000452185 /DNA_START=34 /DNA_END=702 /DNA_ORIENTATION=+ /assembly_acc=CAM_ASM_000160